MSQTSPTESSAVVLFGHGARDPEWAGPMRRIRERLLAQPDAPQVELAFLEFMQPTLPEAIAALAAAGARHIAVVPIFLAQGGHLKRDLPLLLDEVRQAHPQCTIDLATAAGEADPVVAAMAEYARSCVS
ncbi:sirohydrochlorin chelatase [Thauera propionica]|uniref:sirohydrochlorin chelatase n=1 Tax=Thauera propionica TaxID=2019431 RepID=UPI0023F0FC35|nr:CbiX/SirB N-terminal domain-containing protein [Thauera propionica]MDD3677286.1 CbiX/SirB N-terminal domain-containing protein [Thauera propionica]